MSTSLFTAEEKRQVRWFVMRAYKNEKMAEDRLKDKEYGLEYFIPKHYAVRTYHGVKSKKLVPVIPSLLFVHASHSQITEFKKRYNFLQFAMWGKRNRRVVVLLEGVMAVSAEVHPDLIEVLS